MARTAELMVAVALGAVLGFVCRGLLEAVSDPSLAAAPVRSLPSAAEQSSAEADAAGPMRRQIERLRAELASEVAQREELQVELEKLRGTLAAVGEPRSQTRTARPWGDHGAGARGQTARMQWLDEVLLVEAGLHTSDLDALRERFEEIEMGRLYLRDEAAREGWLNTHRYRKAVRELDVSFDALRGEFGDEAYDWLLYASGRGNRVVASGVLENSPAGEAGLKSGDVIFSYDGVRVFGSTELRTATTQGEAGQPAELVLDRGGERIRVFVPRGPLGIRLVLRPMKPTGRR